MQSKPSGSAFKAMTHDNHSVFTLSLSEGDDQRMILLGSMCRSEYEIRREFDTRQPH